MWTCHWTKMEQNQHVVPLHSCLQPQFKKHTTVDSIACRARTGWFSDTLLTELLIAVRPMYSKSHITWTWLQVWFICTGKKTWIRKLWTVHNTWIINHSWKTQEKRGTDQSLLLCCHMAHRQSLVSRGAERWTFHHNKFHFQHKACLFIIPHHWASES